MKSSTIWLATTAASAFCSLFAASAASAEAAADAAAVAPPATTSSAPVATGDRDIIITATRRADRLENVPASIIAVSGPVLQSSGVTNIHDIAMVAPGVQISNSGIYSEPSIRGVSTVIAQLAQETNVALYTDGFYMPDQLTMNMDLSGIQDIQILKGPQGTLYGRNATGGAILITTRSPTDRFQAEGFVKYTPRFNQKAVGGFIGGPITNGIKLSVSAYWRDSTGYVKDINHFSPNVPIENHTWTFSNPSIEAKYGFKPKPFNWTPLISSRRHGNHSDPHQDWYVRPKLVLEPTDNLKITLGYAHTFVNETKTFNFTHASQLALTNPTYNGYPVTTKTDLTSLNFPPKGTTEVDEQNAMVEWKVGDLGTLTARFAHRKQADDQIYDIDGTPADASTQRAFGNVPSATAANDSDSINHRETMVGQLDYNGTFGPLNILSGFFWYHDNANNNNSISETGSAHGPRVGYGYYRTRAWAAYLQSTYNLSDKLFLTVGGRYAHDQRSGFAYSIYGDGMFVATDFQSCYANQALIAGVNPSTSAFVTTLDPKCTGGPSKVKANIFTPQVVVRYNLSPGTNIWGSVTKGFKAAALNLASPFNTLKPETVWSYEVGFKTARGPLRAEASAFYYQFKGNQLSAFNSNVVTISTILLNAGGANIYGLDGSLAYRFPGDRFNIKANFEYLHARYTKLAAGSNTVVVGTNNAGCATLADCALLGPTKPATVVGSWTGRRMMRAPDFSGTITADYTVPLFGGKLVTTANASFSSRYAPTNASYQCFRVAHDALGNEIPYVSGVGYCRSDTNHHKKGLFEENGYVLINLQVAWTDPSDHFTITGFVDNVNNARYLFLARSVGSGIDYKYTAPRAAGIQLGVKF